MWYSASFTLDLCAMPLSEPVIYLVLGLITQRPSLEDWTSDGAVEGVALLHVPTLVADGEPALTLLS